MELWPSHPFQACSKIRYHIHSSSTRELPALFNWKYCLAWWRFQKLIELIFFLLWIPWLLSIPHFWHCPFVLNSTPAISGVHLGDPSMSSITSSVEERLDRDLGLSTLCISTYVYGVVSLVWVTTSFCSINWCTSSSWFDIDRAELAATTRVAL